MRFFTFFCLFTAFISKATCRSRHLKVVATLHLVVRLYRSAVRRCHIFFTSLRFGLYFGTFRTGKRKYQPNPDLLESTYSFSLCFSCGGLCKYILNSKYYQKYRFNFFKSLVVSVSGSLVS